MHFTGYFAILAVAFCWAGAAFAQTAKSGATNSIQAPGTEEIVLPASVPDPLEPFNRVIWEFNQGMMVGVVQPSGRVYRRIIIKPVRKGIGNAGRNIKYPGRLINNLLEGQWTGAGRESLRFLCNTVVGVGGLVDVASKWNIPKSNKDFGLTFGSWGWKPKVFLMLPVAGPSNERDGLGLVGDTAANPLTWVDPPFAYIPAGISYNDLTGTVDDSVRFAKSEADPYSIIQYAWTFARKNQVVDFQVKGEQDQPSLETLQSVFFTFQNLEFPGRGKTRSVLIPATGRRLKFTCWLQAGKAPVVYIVPGLGAHRLAETSLALAELVYKNGFSAVCVSSPFNSEFMEHASTAALPAYQPVDGHDLHVALTEIDRRLNASYPGRLGDKTLMGYSMGAFESLFIAANEPMSFREGKHGVKELGISPVTNHTPLIQFDRYIAINPPVRLMYGVSKLDELYRAPLKWPSAERTDDIENTFRKVVTLSQNTLTPQATLPFNAIESKFLIGLTFRFTLRDIIYSSQRRNNQGVLQHPVRNWRREPVYEEILQYSYQDYFENFVIPYYQARGLASPVAETLEATGDLRTYDTGLRANRNIRVICNENDFLLEEEDLDWLRATFTPGRLTVFEKGGHLGNLTQSDVQKAIITALETK